MQIETKGSDEIAIRIVAFLLAAFLVGWGVATAFIGELPILQQAIYSLTLISVGMSVFMPIGLNLWNPISYDRYFKKI